MTYEFIPLLPFGVVPDPGLFGHWIKDKAHLVAVPAVLVSWLLSLLAFFDVAGGHHSSFRLYTWLTSGMLDIHIGLYDRPADRGHAACSSRSSAPSSTSIRSDTCSGDPGYARFFSYIALFTFSMLMLVMADNFLQLFVFWEAVGLCSYLLIGHWYERPSACAAATKAFIVNRVGDFGFMLGLLLVWYTFGSLDYPDVFAKAHDAAGRTMNILGPFGGSLEVSVLTLICLFSLPAQSANPRSSRCMYGCRTRWKAPRLSQPSFMQRPWSRPVYLWSPDLLHSITCPRPP